MVLNASEVIPPEALEKPITLRCGMRVRLRAIRPDDTEVLAELQRNSTPEDLRMRFFGPIRPGARALTRMLCEYDRDRHIAVAAYDPDHPQGENHFLGVVRLILAANDAGAGDDAFTPEFALFVRSDFKGHGLGHALMQEMLGWARALGVPRVEGQVLWENRPMLRLVRDLGGKTHSAKDDVHVVIVTFDLTGGAGVCVGGETRTLFAAV
jgi:acetyltransferase